MERLLTDLTPSLNKAYISLNRMLADRGVLPEIKAALRARSVLRPTEDSELLPAFTRMLAAAGDVARDIAVPESFSAPRRSARAHGCRAASDGARGRRCQHAGRRPSAGIRGGRRCAPWGGADRAGHLRRPAFA